MGTNGRIICTHPLEKRHFSFLQTKGVSFSFRLWCEVATSLGFTVSFSLGIETSPYVIFFSKLRKKVLVNCRRNMQIETGYQHLLESVFPYCQAWAGISIPIHFHYWHFESMAISLGTFFYLNYRTYHSSVFTCLQNVAVTGHILGGEQFASKVHLAFFTGYTFYKANKYSAHTASMSWSSVIAQGSCGIMCICTLWYVSPVFYYLK